MVKFALKLCLAAGLLLPSTAFAQAIEGRVDRLENEMRAVQRKVFPGGAGQYVQPENTPTAPPMTVPGSPASSPVVDLEARVSAMERQVTSLTGQIETATHRVQVLEDAFANYQRTTDARLKALEGGAGSTSATAPIPDADPVPAPSPSRGASAARTPATGRTGTPAVAVSDPARVQKVAAIERPSTGEPAEDAYLYGYRLWQAKLYPEAEKQLSSVVSTYPDHKRASYARNLLGRSYFEDGVATGNKATLKTAANTFLDNYKKLPDGDRAPESLYFLGATLMKLDAAAGACKAYDEVGRVYRDKVSPELKAKIAAGRVEAKCS